MPTSRQAGLLGLFAGGALIDEAGRLSGWSTRAARGLQVVAPRALEPPSTE